MATREENLKKLNTALEAMSEDELEQVAGGFNHEGAQDSEFLADMGLPCERVGAWRISINNLRLKNRLNKLKRGVRHNQQKNPFGRLSEGFFVV